MLAPELPCAVDPDPDRARAKAREYASLYLQLRNYTANLLDYGFTEKDIANGGSDGLFDAIVPQVSAVKIAAMVRGHLSAGADPSSACSRSGCAAFRARSGPLWPRS